MFKNYFKGIEGIDTYPVLSLLAFFLFFLATMFWLIRSDSRKLNELAKLPFEDDRKDKSDQLNN